MNWRRYMLTRGRPAPEVVPDAVDRPPLEVLADLGALCRRTLLVLEYRYDDGPTGPTLVRDSLEHLLREWPEDGVGQLAQLGRDGIPSDASLVLRLERVADAPRASAYLGRGRDGVAAATLGPGE